MQLISIICDFFIWNKFQNKHKYPPPNIYCISGKTCIWTKRTEVTTQHWEDSLHCKSGCTGSLLEASCFSETNQCWSTGGTYLISSWKSWYFLWLIGTPSGYAIGSEVTVQLLLRCLESWISTVVTSLSRMNAGSGIQKNLSYIISCIWKSLTGWSLESFFGFE